MTGSKALAYWTTTTIVLLALTISATIWQRKRDQRDLDTAAQVERLNRRASPCNCGQLSQRKL